MNKELNTNK